MIGFLKNYLVPLNILEYVVDNYIFDKVQPQIGSVVYCDLIIAASVIQHSGIYVGNGEIVHLNRDGVVEKVNADGFVSGLFGLQCGSSIYVSCSNTSSVGCSYAADVALSEVGNKYDYSIIKFNCHQFVSGCVLGFILEPESMDWGDRIVSSLTGLKLVCRENIGSDNWRVWDR
ncbi:lecithin retinol acyltransferase family protein [Vibrio porteresiae]|uniref:Lecithin retinol acyltransferase family protein n=1 Tax=Vibrio porteresiae DSM 19223 TaxID=1123496 RepID=A0ABZ0QHE7_9VIBR|nr:lecithin retinol acyltransferase family protein [Vibrio porteresiae]WPC75926.1 lecithin retinol acyltransferase family protein [Vibrio porteresiae DSM 19223]